MTAFAEFARQARESVEVVLVTPEGDLLPMSWVEYAAMGPRQMRGYLAFVDVGMAAACAARIWARRAGMS